MNRQIFLTILIAALTGGCAAPINLHNAEAHAQAGYAAKARGDWETARRQFAQAVVNADLGDAGPSGKGQVNYEYGRVLGIMCSWQESEKYLLRSKQFSEQSGRSPFLSLYELGLLNEKQGDSGQAAKYFAELMPLMEKENLRAKYPLGVADAYERYGAALGATGHTAEAEAKRGEARTIRSANPNAMPFGSITPYGSACAKLPERTAETLAPTYRQ